MIDQTTVGKVGQTDGPKVGRPIGYDGRPVGWSIGRMDGRSVGQTVGLSIGRSDEQQAIG